MIVLMGLVAFALMLAEGTAADWSALHAVDIIGVSPAAAGLAYAVFATTMTIGRFVTDPLVQRFGPVRIVRWGSAIGAFGLLLVVLSPWYPLTLVGWMIVGAGLSGTIPQIFTAAGNIPGAPRGATIARVVGAGYIGLMAGPAIIGWLSAAFGLPVALSFGVVCCALGAVLARRVTARTS
jgi:MFS family permease